MQRKGKKGSSLPEGLTGAESHTANGESFCYGFNLGTCSKAEPGKKCNRGWHKCMHKGCKENHAYIDNK